MGGDDAMQRGGGEAPHRLEAGKRKPRLALNFGNEKKGGRTLFL